MRGSDWDRTRLCNREISFVGWGRTRLWDRIEGVEMKGLDCHLSPGNERGLWGGGF